MHVPLSEHGVHAHRGLVEDEQLRVVQEGHGERDSPLLASAGRKERIVLAYHSIHGDVRSSRYVYGASLMVHVAAVAVDYLCAVIFFLRAKRS